MRISYNLELFLKCKNSDDKRKFFRVYNRIGKGAENAVTNDSNNDWLEDVGNFDFAGAISRT